MISRKWMYPSRSDALQVYHYQETLLDRLGQLLGTVHNSRRDSDSLVFLDQNGWLCTLSDEGTVQEHLPLPHDWLDTEFISWQRLPRMVRLLSRKTGRLGSSKSALS